MPPLVLIAAAWIAGLIAAHHWLMPAATQPLSLALLSLVPLALLVIRWSDHQMRLSMACALALVLGAWRYSVAIPDLDDPRMIAHYNDTGWFTVQGVVRSYPDVRDTTTTLLVGVEWIRIEDEEQPVGGALLVTAPRFPEYRYGDRLRLSGTLETPPEFEGFSYRDYLARKGIHSLMYRPRITHIASGQGSAFWTAMFALKDRARDLIARALPDPEAALLQGIALGIRAGIPADVYDDYNATGTSHIIVISGANVAIVVTLVYGMLGRLLDRRRAFWFTGAGITLYVLLVGADAVVVRAAVMGMLYVTARRLGRHATAHVSLFASAVLLTLVSPLALWDVGFQLSFAATLGLALFTPPIERLLDRGLSCVISAERARKLIRALSDVLIVTVAAQILTIPLIAYTMGRLSVIALLTNLLILPVQPAVMWLGGAAVLAGLIPFLEPLAFAISLVPFLCLAYTNAVVRATADLPLASAEIGHVSVGWLALYYSIVLGAMWLLRRRREYRMGAGTRMVRRESTRTATVALAVIAIGALLALLQLPDGRLHVTFLDVGQGDAILITTPRGQQILVDGGPSPVTLSSALGRSMPFWDRSLDLVVMTHSDADHITGLAEVLERYRVDGWLDNGRASNGPIFRQCEALLQQHAIPRQAASAGTRLDLGRGLVLDVLHPQSGRLNRPESGTNNDSVVLRLEWGGLSFLLTGDIEAEAERQLIDTRQTLQSDVLKVAHHGSASSSSVEFLAAVSPSFAVISVGADNLAGHPAPEVMERLLQQGGVTVLRTDELGTIEFTTDGHRLWVRTER